MIVYCSVEDCKHCERGICTQGTIDIVETFHEDAPAMCDDFEERETED